MKAEGIKSIVKAIAEGMKFDEIGDNLGKEITRVMQGVSVDLERTPATDSLQRVCI